VERALTTAVPPLCARSTRYWDCSDPVTLVRRVRHSGSARPHVSLKADTAVRVVATRSVSAATIASESVLTNGNRFPFPGTGEPAMSATCRATRPCNPTARGTASRDRPKQQNRDSGGCSPPWFERASADG